MKALPDRAVLGALLDWYQAMGVDAAVEDEPIDWLATGASPPGARFVLANAEGGEQDAAPPPAPTSQPSKARASLDAPLARPAPPQSRSFPTAPPDAAETAARNAAREAKTIAELGEALARFDGCGLKATAKTTCFFRGAPKARLMIIGEAPGRDEDIAGKPFVGRAGQLLDRMLAAIGLGEADVHITNIVYWRPPGNRTPTPQEAQLCRPFLERQIELVAPDVLMLLGGAAAKEILGVADGIMRLRGKWREIEAGGRRIRTIATLHPAYLLRTPAAKRNAWRDLLAVQAALKGNG
jgi:DNA polymerase